MLINGSKINVENKNLHLKLFHSNPTKIFTNRLFFNEFTLTFFSEKVVHLKDVNVRTKKFDLMGIVIIMNVFLKGKTSFYQNKISKSSHLIFKRINFGICL